MFIFTQKVKCRNFGQILKDADSVFIFTQKVRYVKVVKEMKYS